MGRTAKTKAANVNVTLYDGQFDTCFDCVGAKKCAHAQFYTEPPEPDDDCAFLHNCSCSFAPAQKAALEQIRDRITETLGELES